MISFEYFCVVLLLAVGGVMVPRLVFAAKSRSTVLSEKALQAIEKISPTIEEVGMKLWDISEISLHEVESSNYLKNILKKK
jgi:hypothetical protein